MGNRDQMVAVDRSISQQFPCPLSPKYNKVVELFSDRTHQLTRGQACEFLYVVLDYLGRMVHMPVKSLGFVDRNLFLLLVECRVAYASRWHLHWNLWASGSCRHHWSWSCGWG